MRHFHFTEEERKTINHERFHHPDPNVQRRMEILWLKLHGETHQRIAELAQVSRRTVQRVLKGEIPPLNAASPGGVARAAGRSSRSGGAGRDYVGGPVLALGTDERAEIAAILSRAARAGYLEVEDLKVEARPGEVSLTARVYEPEEEYE